LRGLALAQTLRLRSLRTTARSRAFHLDQAAALPIEARRRPR
jgi:hypothetical protein